MKQVFKRIATITTVLALIVITGITMAACGSNGGENIKNNNIDNLNGYYANIEAQKLYYFDIANETYAYGEFSISDEADENGLYKLKITRHDDCYIDNYKNKLRIYKSDNVCSFFKVWNNNRDTLLVSTARDTYSKDWSKGFWISDDHLVYSKISSLDEFLTTVFPNKVIDIDNVTIVYSEGDTVWKNLFMEL